MTIETAGIAVWHGWVHSQDSFLYDGRPQCYRHQKSAQSHCHPLHPIIK